MVKYSSFTLVAMMAAVLNVSNAQSPLTPLDGGTLLQVQASAAEGFQIYPPDIPNEGILFVDHQSRGGSGHNGQAVVEYGKDHVLAFYLHGAVGEGTWGGHHPLGWTEYRRSTDGGKSWGPPKMLAYSKQLYDHPDYFSGYVKQAVLAPDGSIVAIGCRFLKDYPKFDSAFHIRSHDGGETWQEARVFAPDNPAFGRPQASHVHDGAIYVLFTHGPTWGNHAPHRVYVSTDNGKTFTLRSKLTLDDECWYGAMAWLDNDSIIGYGYRGRDEHTLQYVISEDDGHTWSSPKTTYFAKRIRAPIMSEKIGNYYFMHGRSGHSGEGSRNLVLYSSKDGIQWDEGRFLRVGPGTYAYSNNAVVGRFDPSRPLRLLIQSSIAYDSNKVNVHHWWIGTEPGSLSFLSSDNFQVIPGTGLEAVSALTLPMVDISGESRRQ